jgi:hypothetical protein
LYGPPTTLPWGIPISADHRLPQFPVSQYPVDTTRFHPTFAYEMLWNFAAAGLLLWLSRRYEKDLKPGTLFAGWLIFAGIGRVIIEFFRPDQPKIPELGISYSSIFAALMAIAGAVLLMARYKSINVSFAENWEEEYQLSGQAQPEAESVEEQKPSRAKKSSTTEHDHGATGKTRSKTLPRKMVKPETKPPTTVTKTKKSP